MLILLAILVWCVGAIITQVILIYTNQFQEPRDRRENTILTFLWPFVATTNLIFWGMVAPIFWLITSAYSLLYSSLIWIARKIALYLTEKFPRRTKSE